MYIFLREDIYSMVLIDRICGRCLILLIFFRLKRNSRVCLLKQITSSHPTVLSEMWFMPGTGGLNGPILGHTGPWWVQWDGDVALN